MAIRTVRFGTPRAEGEGPRLGTVRRPPRGVRKEDWGRRDWFDVWVPDLAPTAPLASWALSEPWTPQRWARFARLYRKEMRAPSAQRLIGLLAELSRHTDLAVGCYCEDANRCHRSLLRDLLAAAGAVLVRDDEGSAADRAATSADSTTGARTSPRASAAAPRRRPRAR
jgi:uncharacterized protein YeaO (DUF488 family)